MCPQHTDLSEQKYLAASVMEGVAWIEPPVLDSASEAHLKTQLQYEQCLNRLGQQLSICITAYLSQGSISMSAARLSVEPAVFQGLVRELSGGLNGAWVAIALPTHSQVSPTSTPGEARSELPLTIAYVAAAEGCTSTHPALDLAELTHASLQTLQAAVPQALWTLSDEPTPFGWLLVDFSSMGPKDDRTPTLEALQSQFIERGIRQAVTVLRQIRLLQGIDQRQQELMAHNRELEQMNRLKSEFLANTSHEIRTPLSSILGFTHLLKEQGYSPTNLRHQDYLGIILSSGQHLLALINDILDLSKIEANQLDLQWETIEIQPLCQMALTLVREKANDKGLQLKLNVDLPLTTFVADALRVKQMLFNLLSNAIKFTIQGTVGLTVTARDTFLCFTVWDTGIGIAPTQQHLLFRPYSQISNMVVGRGEGTGLGLALTQKLAELHGGCIEMESEPNRGSRFTIVLPIVPPHSTPAGVTNCEETSAAEGDRCPESLKQPIHPDSHNPNSRNPNSRHCLDSERPNRNHRHSSSRRSRPAAAHDRNSQALETPAKPPSNHLLLVEDNPFNARLMLTYLSRLGYKLTWIRNGAEMWQALERSLPALILMDICLPEIDGLTLIRQLKAHPHYQTIPVIAQTAMAMAGDRKICLTAGAVDYISKPLDLKALETLIARYVPACPC